MDTKTLNSLKRLLAYIGDEEFKSFTEEGEPSDHIYNDIAHLQEWAEIEHEQQLEAIKDCEDCRLSPCAEHTV